MQAAIGDPERVHHIVVELALCRQGNGDDYALPVEDKAAFEGMRRGRIDSP